MKILTPPLIKFGLTAILCTVGFRMALSSLLTTAQFNFIIPVAILFALLMFLVGRFFGKKDNAYLPIYDVGFRFHLITFLQYHIVSYIWFWYGTPSTMENIGFLNITLVIWGIFLVIHAFYYIEAKKNAIKSIHKDDLFD